MKRAPYKPGEKIEFHRTGNTFTVEEEPKKGGMGIVYIARRKRDNKLYALKTFREDKIKNWEHRNVVASMFEWESHVWIILGKHRNVVQAHWFDVSKNYEPFLIMEYIECSADDITLKGWIKGQQGRRPDIPAILNFAIQALTGLIYAREVVRRDLNRAFIHRDIKPGNLFISRDGTLKVSDFGLVRVFGNLERAGGTPAYMPPEQWRGEDVEEKTDVYALGRVIYEVMNQKTGLEAISQKLSDIVQKCLERKSGSRPSFCELREELQKLHLEITGERVAVKDEPEPFSADDWNGRGSAFYHLGLPSKAIDCYDKAIAMEPEDERFYLNRGNSYFQLEWFEEALSDYRKAMEVKPGIIEAYIGIANVLCKKQQYQEALESYNEAKRVSPDEAKVYWGKGIVYAMRGQYDKALKEFDKALKKNSQLAEAWLGKGNVYLCKGEYGDSERCYKKAIQINSQYVEAYRGLARVYDYQGRSEEWEAVRSKLSKLG